MVEQRDLYTAGHERRVGELAAAIGTEMGLPENTVKGLRLTGFVHDVGKISVAAELLSKPAKLSPLEFELIKTHAETGYDVLKGVDFPWPVADVVEAMSSHRPYRAALGIEACVEGNRQRP